VGEVRWRVMRYEHERDVAAEICMPSGEGLVCMVSF